MAEHALRRSRRQAASGDAVLVAIGIALDVVAAAEFADSPSAMYDWDIAKWAVLWLGWRAIVAAALIRHSHAPAKTQLMSGRAKGLMK